MLTIADDFGRFEADPRVLASLCFPLWAGKITPKSVEKWYGEMEKADLVVSYLDQGKKYGHFPTWERHQTVRAKTSKYPAPAAANICKHVQANVPVFVFGNEVVFEKRESETNGSPPAAARTPSRPAFQIDPSIIAALDRAPKLGGAARCRRSDYWQAIIRAYPGVDYPAVIAESEAYLTTHPHYKDHADFLRGSIQRAHRRIAV